MPGTTTASLPSLHVPGRTARACRAQGRPPGRRGWPWVPGSRKPAETPPTAETARAAACEGQLWRSAGWWGSRRVKCYWARQSRPRDKLQRGRFAAPACSLPPANSVGKRRAIRWCRCLSASSRERTAMWKATAITAVTPVTKPIPRRVRLYQMCMRLSGQRKGDPHSLDRRRESRPGHLPRTCARKTTAPVPTCDTGARRILSLIWSPERVLIRARGARGGGIPAGVNSAFSATIPDATTWKTSRRRERSQAPSRAPRTLSGQAKRAAAAGTEPRRIPRTSVVPRPPTRSGSTCLRSLPFIPAPCSQLPFYLSRGDAENADNSEEK